MANELIDKIKALEKELRLLRASKHIATVGNINRDGLPLNTSFIGISKGTPFVMVVNAEGKYVVGMDAYDSLSAAAEAVSGVRRSGWTFWRLLDRKTTLKEAYGKK